MANSYLIERVLLSIAWPFILQQDKHVLALGLYPALSGELVSFCGFLLKDSPEVPQFRNSPFLTCILQRMIGLSKCQKMWVPIYLLHSTSFVTFGKLNSQRPNILICEVTIMLPIFKGKNIKIKHKRLHLKALPVCLHYKEICPELSGE